MHLGRVEAGNNGIVNVPSNHSVDETVESLKNILQAKGVNLFAVVDHSGKVFGTVIAIFTFGAGDLIEVRPQNGGKTEMLPFDATHVPEIDIAGGFGSIF